MAEFFRKAGEKTRLAVQIMWAALTNGYAAGFISGQIYTGPTKGVCVPGLSCYSCPGAFGACPIGSLQAVLGNSNFRFSYYVAGFLIFVGVVAGRFVCGWLCPFGLVQDLLYKLPFFRKRKNLPGHKGLKWLRFILLAVFVILMPLFAVDIIGQGAPAFCKYICPAGTLMAGIPLAVLDPLIRPAIGFLYRWKLAVLIAVILLSLWVYRPFCKYLCPLGAVYGLFHPISALRIELDKSKCIKCKRCQNACKMDIAVWLKPNSMECIRCGDCLKVCPTGALSERFGLKERIVKRRIES